ncbi:transcriptional regulator domain-containing protein [Sphingomonas abietis]|uniref:transcriptional regulator domain-containing protein n=1 Tax=Sphingomonas abietis TaxID=3012344 RepID=UPI0038998027
MTRWNLSPSPGLVERPVEAIERLCDPGQFAWEILRRRRDYEGEPVTTWPLRGGSAPVAVVEANTGRTPWGLRFRGRPVAARLFSEVVLGCRS